MRLINADELEQIIQKQVGECKIKVFEPSVNLILQDIRYIPTIEAEPVKRGLWDENTVPFCNVCQECGAVVERHCVKSNGTLKRCPNCGARMEREPDA